ncbi:MAG: hypothetical protein WED15_04980 [Akkermansiaceae bacterium]
MNHSLTFLTRDFASALPLADAQPPCISLFQPCHRHYPGNLEDPIRFRNLVKELEQTLGQSLSAAEISNRLAPFNELAEDVPFWNHTLDGLAVFSAPGFFEVLVTQRPVSELVVVADSFHTKPLRRLLQTTDRFQVLGLSRRAIRLFEGNRDVLDEIDLAPGVQQAIGSELGVLMLEPSLAGAAYTGTDPETNPVMSGQPDKSVEIGIDSGRFFRAVGKAIYEHHSQPSGLPLILAALPEHHALFHQVGQNPFLIEEGIKIHPDATSIDDLRERAWEAFGPRYQARLAALGQDFSLARAKGLGSDSLEQVAEAAWNGRVDSLLIEAERQFPGHLDDSTGKILRGELSDPEIDDLLDDLADLVESKGGKVMVVPGASMPSQTGLAAVFRF